MVTSAAPSQQRAGLRLWLLAFAQFIIAVDYNIVYVALPDIGKALDFNAQSLQWVVSAYAVGFGGLLLFGGRAVDRLGQRRIWLLALGVYAVASLAGGLATGAGMLVAARAVQGFGGALLFPATLSLIMTTFEEGPARTKAMGAWGSAGGAGLSAGALLGGVFTEYTGWTWVFFINVPLAIIALIAGLKVLPADAPRTGRTGSFDIPGAILATAGCSLLVFGLVSGPQAGWGSLQGAGSIVLGLVLLIGFLLVEKATKDPLVPLSTFSNRSLSPSMAVILVYQACLGAAYYLLTTFLQPVLGFSAIEAGLAFLPLTVISVLALGQVGPRMIGKYGARMTLFVGMIGTGIGLAAMVAGMTVGGSFWTVLPGIAFFGLAGGVTFVTMFVAAGTGVAPEQQGVASALASTSQQAGGAMGLAVLVAVANSTLHTTSVATASAAHIVDGLRLAGVIGGAATVVGAFFALLIKKDSPAAVSTVDATETPVTVG
ncbi:EmrB/QacA subfamily drug resistance transporter [Kitasatospora sp. MAA4]|uniref:MFS transporter n=1 Tax=Kitasatospora sp. MAA4 TaxID=3035093 RepID=UPI00247310E4|nr:MFS transporter [Kitasatospora sp. MAA4]MDH6134250.1 EmrB/QacA subfamily drug resistance transporter [Kitasatospora sp. MAA4]